MVPVKSTVVLINTRVKLRIICPKLRDVSIKRDNRLRQLFDVCPERPEDRVLEK